MAWVRLIKNNIQHRISGTINQLQTLVNILVHNDWHARNDHKDGRYRYLTVISLAQDHKGLLLRRFAIFLLIVGNENPKGRLLLPLERQYAFEIQVPPVLVQRRYYYYARFPWNPSTLMITFIV